jgi:hypothetical protein
MKRRFHMPTKSDDRGAPATGDELSGKRPTRVRISASPAGVRLRNFLNVVYSLGDNAEEDYQRALRELSEYAEEVLAEIARASADCHEQDYPLRLALVQTAVSLRHPAALPYLANLVKTPIPEEQSGDPHSYSTVAEETIIRTTAVDGIAEHAKNDDERAVALLMEFLRIPSFSIRRAAVYGLLATKNAEEYREKIKCSLPEDQQFILDLRKTAVRDIPQVKDPTRHLKHRMQEGKIPAPPRLTEEPEGGAPKAY